MNKTIKLTCLSNDWLGDYRMLAEHGFSLLINIGNDVILFDTGGGLVLAHNSKVAGLDLGCVQKLVLSHGHFDHTGGLGDVLRHNPRVEIHAHPLLFEEKYRQLEDGTHHYIGYQRSLPTRDKLNFVPNTGSVQIADNVYLTGEIPRNTGFESVKRSFVLMRDGAALHDELIDDQAMIISTDSGLILVVGCAHSGIINTVHRAMEVTSCSHFRLIIGGTHLIDANQDRIAATLKALQGISMEKLILAHCTGLEPLCAMKAGLGETVSALLVGDTCEMPL